jgi:hypothetical protein
MKKHLHAVLFALFILGIAGTSPAQTILISENFSSGTLPAGWSQDSAGVTPVLGWSFNNPGARVISGAGFDSLFVILDSDHYGQDTSEDVYLNLPLLNASSLVSVYLVLDEQYRDWTNGFHQIEVSNNGGISWTGILSDSDATDLGYPNPVHSVYDITALAAGQSSVNIRFHYAATWGYWWALDNVVVADFTPCFGGDASSSVTYSCGTDSLSLDLIGSSGSPAYQWQVSPDGSTWTDISGATTVPYTVSQGASSYYRCVLTCGVSQFNSFPVSVPFGPSAGFAITSLNQLCNNTVTFDLSLNGASADPWLTYQWQSSPDDINWTNIPLQTSASYLGATQSVSTYYRCNVSCSNATVSSVSVYVAMNQGAFCYCDAPNSVLCTFGEFISNVSITGTSFNNTSRCDSINTLSNYSFYLPSANTSANLTRNTSYDFNVTASFDAIISVWIDFNANGNFDTSEWVQVCSTSGIDSVNTVSWVIPSTAVVGPTGMRVRSRETANANGPGDACTLMYSGETEDYVVGIEFNVGEAAYSSQGISLYPNPTSGFLNFIFSDYHGKTNVSLYDMLGNRVANEEFTNTYQANLDLSAFSNGIYFIKLENSKGLFSQKIILNK